MFSSIKLVALFSILGLSEAHLRPHVARTLDSNGRWRRGEVASTGATEDNSNAQESLTLLTSVVQSNSNILGTESGVNGSTTAGIVASATSPNNFINFCSTSSKPLMNGVQIRTGACNPIPMGEIGDFDTAPETKIAFPTNGGTVAAETNFTVLINMKNFNVGSFTNADSTYYTAPCQLDATTGFPTGHSHIVIQAVNGVADTTPLAPNTFTFFLGLKGGIDANGQISGAVTGLPAGTYRLATINTCSNHQALNGAIAQRGAFDDMVYFTVTGSGSTTGTTTTNVAVATSTTAAASTTTATATTTSATGSSGTTSTATSTENFQVFTAAESLGEIAPPPVTNSGDSTRPFEVEGDTFVNLSAAIQRSCSVQNNACADAANAGGQSFNVGDCNSQETQCNDANANDKA